MIDVVLITTRAREDLLHQSMTSLIDNAADRNSYELTIVWDGEMLAYGKHLPRPNSTLIINRTRYGASASRNIGASSIPRYRRQKYLLFLDDDVWLAPEYDKTLIEMSEALPRHMVSLYGHPYNHEEDCGNSIAKFPLLISSVCVFMTWEAWDEIGFWLEPGGPSASEDFEYCSRAKKLGYGFAVSKPHRLIHCGLTASNGNKIVGYDLLVEQNKRLVEQYGVKVRFE